MIIGIGLDSEKIERIKKNIKSKRFLDKIYSPKEQDFLQTKREQSYAANFCAKEAFSKAIGTGMGEVWFNEIEVLRDDKGKPYIVLYGKTKTLFEKSNGKNIHLSLCHTDEYAQAFVIIEG